MASTRWSMQKISCLVALVLIVFVLCSVTIFPDNIGTGGIAEDIDVYTSTESFSPVQSRYSFAVMPHNNLISQNNKTVKQDEKRALSTSRIMVYRQVTLPYYLFTAVILCRCLTIVKRIRKCTSKIALSIGGHSPPSILSNLKYNAINLYDR